jgi:hypothetical protein
MTTPLQTQRDSIQQQLDAINLGAMHTAVESAKATTNAYCFNNANAISLANVACELTRLRGAANQAEHDLHFSESEVGRLIRERAHLDEMLNSEARILATDAAILPARADMEKATIALAAANSVLTEVEALLASAQVNYQQANTQAAADLLIAVRKGIEPTPYTADRGHLDALNPARATAFADLQAAQAELDRVQGSLDEALHDRLAAQTNATERDLHLAAWAYAGALVVHEAACWASRSHFAEPDVDLMTREVKRGLDGFCGDPGALPQTTQGAEARKAAQSGFLDLNE